MVKNKKLLVMVCLLAAGTSLQAADPAVQEKIKSIRATYAGTQRTQRNTTAGDQESGTL
jgi:hypothetical protein